MTTYCSTKAYVFSFSKSLREETKKRGINVLAVCPAPMDTEFLAIAGIEGKSKLFDRLPHVSPKEVAQKSLKKLNLQRKSRQKLPKRPPRRKNPPRRIPA